MSLKPQERNPITEETIRVARAVFPKGEAIMPLREHVGSMDTDEPFRVLVPPDWPPAFSPGR